MPNIKFSYFYRDAGNYKKYGEVVFSNPERKTVEEICSLIKQKLIDGQWFYAHEWHLPDLHFEKWNAELDHGFHEFECVTHTDEHANYDRISLGDFCELVLNTDWRY